MGSERPSKPPLFMNRGQQLESFSRSNSDETSTINSHVQRWRIEQLRPQKSLSGPDKGSLHDSTPFMFVNKGQDSGSFSKSKDTEAAIINSHSQRWRNQRIRQQKNEALRSHAAGARKVAILGWQSGKIEKKPAASSEPPISPEEEEHDIANALCSKTDLTTVRPSYWYTRHGKTQAIQTNFSKGNCLDPFSVTAVPISKETQSLLCYFLTMAIPATYKAETLPKEQPPGSLSLRHRYSPAVEAIVGGALFNKMHLYALLTATAGCMKHIAKIGLSKSDSPEIYMQKAIIDIRAYLESRANKVVDKQVVMDVFYLCVFEWYLQNYDAALVHLTAVKNMMKSIDASGSALDQYIQETICYNDVFISIETATPPLLPLTWDSPPLSMTRWAQIRTELSTFPEYRRMGTGFMGILSRHIFGAAMEAILAEFIVWIDVAQYTWIGKTATNSDAEWIFRKGKAILHRLVSIPAMSLRDLTLLPLQRKEECCRFVLIILLSYISTQTAWRSGKMNMARLQKALWSVDVNWGSDFLNHMLLWVLTCGAFAAEGAPEEDWFVLRVVKVARLIDVSDYDTLDEVMSEFFYSRELQNASMHKLAKRMLDENGGAFNSRQ